MDVRHDHPTNVPSASLAAAPHTPARSVSPAAGAAHEPAVMPGGDTVAKTPHTRRVSVGQLEAMFASMADGVISTDRDGHILTTNTAARRLLALDARPDFERLPPAERLRLLQVRDALGNPVPEERIMSWSERLLAGNALSSTDTGALAVRAFDGHDVALSVSAAPLRNAHGAIVGAVWIIRDVTELRQLRRRTRETLAALVAMAEMLVPLGPSAPGTASDASRSLDQATAHTTVTAIGEATSSDVAQRLAQLALIVMGCRQLDIIAVGMPQSELRLVASTSLTACEEQRWRAKSPWHGRHLRDILPPGLAAQLEHGECILIDHTDPKFAPMPKPFGTCSTLLTPMQLGGRLVGFLALDYGPIVHTFTPEEIALAAGTTRLVALVLERDRLLREREEARANALALSEANRRMDDFLSVAAHELRAPVQASLIGVELAQLHVHKLQTSARARAGGLAKDIDDLAEVLAQSTESVERLAHLVANLLDASRAQAGRLDIRSKPADLAAIVREAVARQRDLAPARAILLHLPTTTHVPVLADADRITEVVANFIGNALKYAPEDRPVEVCVRVRGGWGRVSVRDEGPGLSVEEQRRIWERYHQAPGIQANPGMGVGLGLGLYIAREIVRAHGGKIGVRSIPGRGSTFWFTLPLDGTAE